MKSVVGCTIYNDSTSCQQFANLCVLALYHENDEICRLYINAMAARPESAKPYYFPE
jgi:hypothetical protein